MNLDDEDESGDNNDHIEYEKSLNVNKFLNKKKTNESENNLVDNMNGESADNLNYFYVKTDDNNKSEQAEEDDSCTYWLFEYQILKGYFF